MKNDYIEFEKTWLSPYAVPSDGSRGREKPLASGCDLRTDFQRDRDRIIHCKSFRRLKHKTQVFLSPTGDHYRTRLTHTLEVTQIARTIARALRLNEDLTEAIALGHDLGHTPFGHIGEKVLNDISGHFEHNEQSLRVVEKLENDGRGLNLTFEVRDGILNHKTSCTPATLEGKIVNFADRIAYLNHDIDDAIEGGVITEKDLPRHIVEVLGDSKGERINSLVRDIVMTSLGNPKVTQSPEFAEIMNELRSFMFERVYFSEIVLTEEKRATKLLGFLFEHFVSHPEEIPSIYLIHTDDPKVAAVDYIASMSDTYAVAVAKSVLIPDMWEG